MKENIYIIENFMEKDMMKIVILFIIQKMVTEKLKNIKIMKNFISKENI